MIKVAFLNKRRADMTRDEFIRYSKEVHVPLVARLPGLKRYVVTYNAVNDPTDGLLDYDALIEIWFDSVEDFQTAYHSPEAEAAKTEYPNFMDASVTQWMMGEEYEVLDHTKVV